MHPPSPPKHVSHVTLGNMVALELVANQIEQALFTARSSIGSYMAVKRIIPVLLTFIIASNFFLTDALDGPHFKDGPWNVAV